MNLDQVTNTIDKIWSITVVKIIIVVILAVVFNYILRLIINRLFHPVHEVNIRNKQLIQKSRETANKVILTVIKIIIWVSAILMIFSLLNIDTSSFLAGAGFFGLIIGLGTRNFIESLVTGFFLIADGNISIGDYVRINKISGVVIDIGIRNITIQMNTGELNIQPVVNIKDITNYSIDNNRVLMNLKISMKYDFMKIMNSLNKSIKEMTQFIDTKTDLYISGFNLYENNYEIRIACQVVEETNITVQALVKTEIAKSLKEDGIILEDDGTK